MPAISSMNSAVKARAMATRASLSHRSLNQRSLSLRRQRPRPRQQRPRPRHQRPRRNLHPLHLIRLPTHRRITSASGMMVSWNFNIRQIWKIYGANVISLDCAVTSYIIKEMIAAKETVIPIMCDHKKYPQACAGYCSAIHAGGLSDTFTCTQSHHDGRLNGQVTKDWSDQHQNGQWKSFTQASVTNNKNQAKESNCQRDEYPVS
jgi:hypothetical protein